MVSGSVFSMEEDASAFGTINSLETCENKQPEQFNPLLSRVSYIQNFIPWLQHLFLYLLLQREKSFHKSDQVHMKVLVVN